MITKRFNLPSLLVWRKVLALMPILLAIVCESLAQDTTALLVIKNVPMIKGSINGKPAFFVVDTGASITILNGSLARMYNYKVIDNRYLERCRIIGLGGESVLREAKFVTVRLGGHDLNFINKVADLNRLSSHFEDYDIQIAGIIGTDLLRILGGVIDMQAETITFKEFPEPQRRRNMEDYFADREH